MTDLDIAQQATMRPILPLAKEKLGIEEAHLTPYGHYKAKISLDYLQRLEEKPNGKLILVTAMSPTPAGEGKTTTSIGLADALNLLGKKTMLCLREPSLGPCFGMKGGAAGGGFSQVLPMEDINLHFTGDFHAIGLAHNLLSALIDNHIYHGNALGIDQRRITWKRVVDMNDRALRSITVGLGGLSNGFPRSDGFDIVVASEVMAIFCLSQNLLELKERLGNIIIGASLDNQPICARDLHAHGAMAALLKDAFAPNLVQTLEGNLALIHGGPFANIAHGCNSLIATKSALKMADYVVTEAGFGADLGAEKFIDIKCQKSGLYPNACVIVATIRALKYHGGITGKDLNTPNLNAIQKGLPNLMAHINNLREHCGLPCVVAINQFPSDSSQEIDFVQHHLLKKGIPSALATHWRDGGKGASQLAELLIESMEKTISSPRFFYPQASPLLEKIHTLATKIYGAKSVNTPPPVLRTIKRLEEQGYGHYPLCVAKTPYSFSTNPKKRGAPTGHILNIREVRLAAGAEFIIMLCGDLLTMPGLPKEPAAHAIDIDCNGQITGLF